jgi:hypothetical protein
VLLDRLPLLLSEVHEGVAAFPSPSAELAAAVPRHPDPAGIFAEYRVGATARVFDLEFRTIQDSGPLCCWTFATRIA